MPRGRVLSLTWSGRADRLDRARGGCVTAT